MGPHFTLMAFLQLVNRLNVLPAWLGAFAPDNMFMFLKDQNILSAPTSCLQTTQALHSVGKSLGIKILMKGVPPQPRTLLLKS